MEIIQTATLWGHLFQGWAGQEVGLGQVFCFPFWSCAEEDSPPRPPPEEVRLCLLSSQHNRASSSLGPDSTGPLSRSPAGPVGNSGLALLGTAKTR